jgi:hypothetical protein
MCSFVHNFLFLIFNVSKHNISNILISSEDVNYVIVNKIYIYMFIVISFVLLFLPHNLRKSGGGLMKVISRNLPGRTEENHEKD